MEYKKNMTLVDNLICQGWLKTPRIIDAFRKVNRVDFLPKEIKNLAELNEALPIGFNQTISQPLVVAFMMEHLQPQPNEKILDIGSGSGWTAALLAQMVGEKGKVIAMEIVPELIEFAKENVNRYSFLKKGIVQFICGDGTKAYPKEAPFDKILVSAEARKCFPEWKKQLKIGGIIIVPIGSSVWKFVKKTEDSFEEVEYPGFKFVPLVED